MIHALLLIAVQVANGTVVDPSVSPPTQGSAFVAAAPEIGAVLCVDITGPSTARKLQARLLHPGTGSAVAVDPAVLPGGTASAQNPAVAWNPVSRTFLVTWSEADSAASYGINGRLLSETGSLLGSEFRLTQSTRALRFPRAASDGTGFAVVWSYSVNNPVITVLPAAAGAFQQAGGDIDIDGGGGTTVSYGAQGCLVTTGASAGPVLTIYSAASAADDVYPTVSGVPGGNYVAAWRQGGTVYARSINSTSGATGAASSVMGSSQASTPSLTVNSITGRLVAASITAANQIQVRTIDATGVASGLPVSHTAAGSILLNSGVSVVHVAETHQVVASFFITGGVLEVARFNGADLSLLARLQPTPLTAALAPADTTIGTALFGGTNRVVARFTTTSAGGAALEALSYDVGSNSAGPVVSPGSLAQTLSNGTAVPVGSALPTRRIVLAAAATAPAPGNVAIQFEVNGVPVATIPGVTQGIAAQVTYDALPGQSYQWRARAIGSTGIPSPWLGLGGAPDFIAPPNGIPMSAAPGQARFGTGETVTVGFVEAERRGIRLESVIDDVDGDVVRFDVEIRDVGTAFTGTATASSGYIAPGGIAVIELANLQGDFHWQSRVVDSLSGASAWTPFGGNSEDAADFRVLPFGSLGAAQGCAQSAGGASALLILALALGIGTLRPGI